jgi:glycosyltransferase involved in cell wall biosynthesis
MLFFSVEKFSEYNILPGRIFDYLFSGKPIIASVPPGSEAEELLSEYPAAIMVTDGDISRIAEGIKKFADNAGMETGLSEQSLRKYSAESVAQNYARMLDRVLK